MPEKSIIQIRAFYYPKGSVITVRKDQEDPVTYPSLVIPKKSLEELLRPLTLDDARVLSDKNYDLLTWSLSDQYDHYEVMEDFYAYEPGHVSGYSLDGAYCSGAEYDIAEGGVEDVFDDMIEEIHKDFLPLFKAAEKKKFLTDKSHGLESRPQEMVVQHPAILEFTSSYHHYDGEYDCWTEYGGLLNLHAMVAVEREEEEPVKLCV